MRCFYFLNLSIFLGNFKDHLIMASTKWRHTVPEILDYLDDKFDIPNDGVNFDIEGLDEDFDEENDLLPEVAASEDEDNEDVDLAALDIQENDKSITCLTGHLVLYVIVSKCPLGHEVVSHKVFTYDSDVIKNSRSSVPRQVVFGC